MGVHVGNPDAAFAAEPWLAFVDNVQRTALTGQEDDLVVDDPYTLLLCGNASPLVLSGLIVSGENSRDGSRILIVNAGTSTVQVTHQDTDSAAGNRFVCESAAGQILGPGGALLAVFDATAERWVVVLLSPGAPIAVAHSAGNFTAGGSQTWTVASGDQLAFRYQQRGTVVTVWLDIATSTVGGTPDTLLKVALPNGFAVAQPVNALCAVRDNTTRRVGRVVASATDTDLSIENNATGATNWAAATDQTAVALSGLQVEVA